MPNFLGQSRAWLRQAKTYRSSAGIVCGAQHPALLVSLLSSRISSGICCSVTLPDCRSPPVQTTACCSGRNNSHALHPATFVTARALRRCVFRASGAKVGSSPVHKDPATTRHASPVESLHTTASGQKNVLQNLPTEGLRCILSLFKSLTLDSPTALEVLQGLSQQVLLDARRREQEDAASLCRPVSLAPLHQQVGVVHLQHSNPAR